MQWLQLQRWGGEPNARTCAINFVLRSVLFDPAKPPAERAKAVAMRLRLSSKMLLSARHSDYIGLSVRTDMLHGHEVAAARDGRGQRLRAGLLDGDGARSTGDLFAEIVELIVERCIPAVSALEQDVYDLRARLFRAKSRAKPSVAGPKLLPIRELICDGRAGHGRRRLGRLQPSTHRARGWRGGGVECSVAGAWVGRHGRWHGKRAGRRHYP